MAKTKKRAGDVSDEDYLIAQGLSTICEGILSADWSKVCEGYNSISGEELEVAEKPKSRLEKIRESLNTKTAKPKEKVVADVDEPVDEKIISKEALEVEDAPRTDWASLKVVDLQKKLRAYGVPLSEIRTKGKPALIKLGKELEEKQGTLGVITKESADGFRIITTEFDETEANANKAAAAKQVKMPKQKRDTTIADTSNTEQDSRFYNNPPVKPAWR